MTRRPSVSLVLVKGDLDPPHYRFEKRTTCVLGRSSECAPRLPDDHEHRTVSRHHCLLDINPPQVRIRDFGSLNGTYVNNVKIGQRAHGQTPEQGAAEHYPEHDLTNGDEIRVGNTVFRVGVDRGAESRNRAHDRCIGCGAQLPHGMDRSADDPLCADCRSDPRKAAEELLRQAVRAPIGSTGNLESIAGYTIVRELGAGGMGAVYLARQHTTGNEVALKVMLPRTAVDDEAHARFLREIELTRALTHPNIAELHDSGCARGVFYFTTEYCSGGSLDQMIKRRGGKLPPAEAVHLIGQALDGLEHAHAHGVVHRDLTPHNILISTKDGDGPPVVKIADFGLAKTFDDAGFSGLTRTGTAAGKPWYLPRQQIIDFRNVDPAVDVWALAACLYNALTGTYPRDFPLGIDPWVVVLGAQPVPVRDRVSDIPQGLARVVDQALTDNPEIGYTTTGDLRAALAHRDTERFQGD